MRPLDELERYLRRIEQRLLVSALARGAAIAGLSALVATVALVWIANSFQFAPSALTWSRFLLFLSVAFAVTFGIVLPLIALNRRRAAQRVEQRFPEFQEKLITCIDQKEAGNPFIDLVAADAMKVAVHAHPQEVSRTPWIAALGSAGVAAVGMLMWLISAGPGYLGYGAALLWGATPRENTRPFYEIVVMPGDQLVRRKSDQTVTARLLGFTASEVKLHARYKGSTKWESAPMVNQAKLGGYEFLFAGLPESVDYFVEASGTRSKEFKFTVIDLPAVKKLKVAYRFPAWTGLKPVVDEQSGDLRAVQGTEAEVLIETDKPLAHGVLVMQDGTRIPLLTGEKNALSAKVTIERDGMYYVAAIEQGQAVRLTEDYFIEAKAELPPTIRLSKPGRDAKANPLEEVPIELTAEDDFGLQAVELHYAVNGGEDKTINMLPAKGAKTVDGKHLMTLEDFKLVPGDIVAVYAVARDARSQAQTDIYFIEAQPFERNYTQSQQGGGGGGGGDEDKDDEISKRQKEIIAATWNEVRSKDKSLADEHAKFLSDMQNKLQAQAASLAKRMKARELTGAGEAFAALVKEMESAASEMGSATDKLKVKGFKDALPHEQKALQFLMRAEARRRDIQVAFGQQGGGGGGGGSGRDLENLFDLELDTEKNQYETGQQSASGGQKQKAVDEALQRLEQLARRQQELAQQAQRNQLTPQQRWQQEMLRREAEQLQRQMEQLTRGEQSQQANSQSQQGQQGQQGQQSGQQGQQGQQSGQTGQSGQQQGRQMQQGQQQRQQQQQGQQQARMNGQRDQIDPRIKQALDRLSRATDDMRRGGESSADSRRAAERLGEARDMLRGMRQQDATSQLDQLSQRSSDLANRQREFANRMNQTYGMQGRQGPAAAQPTPLNNEQNERLAQEKLKLMDDYNRLERDLKDASRELASTKKGASDKVRRALGELDAEDISLKMKYMSEYLKRGYGNQPGTREQMWMREQPVTRALDQLRDRMKDAAEGAGNEKDGSGKPGVESALNRLEDVRTRMEQLARQGGQQGQGQPGQGQQAGQRGQGQQPGQGQPGQQGQGQAQGQQPGQQGQGQGQGQQGQGGQGRGGQQPGGMQGGGQGSPSGQFGGGGGDRRGEFGAMNNGDRQGQLPNGGMNGLERTYREGLRDLQQLRQAIGQQQQGQQNGGGDDVGKDVEALIRQMQQIDPSKFPGNPELVERIRSQVLPAMEQLEVQLRRQVEEQNSGQVKTGTGGKIPQGYSDAVAEYYRRLGKVK